jgi:hypothetical protein
MKTAEQLKYIMLNKWHHVTGVIDLNVKLYFFVLTL